MDTVQRYPTQRNPTRGWRDRLDTEDLDHLDLKDLKDLRDLQELEVKQDNLVHEALQVSSARQSKYTVGLNLFDAIKNVLDYPVETIICY